MESQKPIDTCLHVLEMIRVGKEPDVDDILLIKSYASPEESSRSVSELARELIQREIAKRRATGRLPATTKPVGAILNRSF